MMKKLTPVFKAYQRCLEKRPFLTNSIMTGTLVATGDIIAQGFFSDKPHYDEDRTIRMVLIGSGLVAPVIYEWYRLMEKFVGPKRPLVKLAIDQLVLAPLLAPTILMAARVMEGKSLDRAAKCAVDQSWPILKVHYSAWPVIQGLNFAFVPFVFRTTVVQVAALLWCVKTSRRVYLEKLEEKENQKKKKNWHTKGKPKEESKVEKKKKKKEEKKAEKDKKNKKDEKKKDTS